jgi:hypothetical protein
MMSEAGKHLKAILQKVSIDVAIGYGLFLFVAVFVSVVSTTGSFDLRITLADLLTGDMSLAGLGKGGGRELLLVLLATATIAVPYFWRNRLASLAYAVPLLVTAYGFWPLYEQHNAEHEAIEALGELAQMTGQSAEQLGVGTGGPLDDLGIGAWVLIATVLYLALRGIARVVGRA